MMVQIEHYSDNVPVDENGDGVKWRSNETRQNTELKMTHLYFWLAWQEIHLPVQHLKWLLDLTPLKHDNMTKVQSASSFCLLIILFLVKQNPLNMSGPDFQN